MNVEIIEIGQIMMFIIGKLTAYHAATLEIMIKECEASYMCYMCYMCCYHVSLSEFFKSVSIHIIKVVCF